MRRSRRWNDAEEGSAALELVMAGLILLLPLVYVVLALASIQGGALAVEGAARQAARVFAQSGSAAEAEARAMRAVGYALADHGMDAGEARVSIACSPHPDACLSRLGTVTVTVSATALLPLLPQAVVAELPLSVPLTASATERVSRFWHELPGDGR